MPRPRTWARDTSSQLRAPQRGRAGRDAAAQQHLGGTALPPRPSQALALPLAAPSPGRCAGRSLERWSEEPFQAKCLLGWQAPTRRTGRCHEKSTWTAGWGLIVASGGFGPVSHAQATPRPAQPRPAQPLPAAPNRPRATTPLAPARHSRRHLRLHRPASDTKINSRVSCSGNCCTATAVRAAGEQDSGRGVLTRSVASVAPPPYRPEGVAPSQGRLDYTAARTRDANAVKNNRVIFEYSYALSGAQGREDEDEAQKPRASRRA